MPTLTSSVPEVLEALTDALNARSDLGVDTTGKQAQAFCEMQGEASPLQSIQFFGCHDDQAFHTIGGRVREETYTIEGGIFVEVAGAGPKPARTARRRAYALLSCVEKTLRGDPHLAARLAASGALLLHAELKDARLEQFYLPDGRVAAIEFHVACKARLETDPTDL